MRLPPYATLLGIESDGTDLVMPFADTVVGRPGFLHGGAIAGLMEMTAAVTLHRALAVEGGGRIKPINVTVDFMRGGRNHATRARATVTRLGTRVANVETIAWQDTPDKPIAAARTNYLIVRT